MSWYLRSPAAAARPLLPQLPLRVFVLVLVPLAVLLLMLLVVLEVQ
jgi:hypothetical protein